MIKYFVFNKIKLFFCSFIFGLFLIDPISVLASNSSGTFDPNNLGYNKAFHC